MKITQDGFYTSSLCIVSAMSVNVEIKSVYLLVYV